MLRLGPLTATGGGVLALTALAYVVGWRFGWVELLVVAAAGVAGLLLAVPFVVGRLRLDLKRTVDPDRVQVGNPGAATLTMTNTGRSLSRARTIDEFINGRRMAVSAPLLKPGESERVVYTLDTSRRGVIELGPAVVAKSDPLGLMRREVGQIGRDTLWVHPKIVALETLPAGFAKDLEGPTSDASPAGDVAFHTLREYTPGDDIRHIHWMSSARSEQLLVRHYVDNRIPRIGVVLDDFDGVYEDESSFELAVSIAGSLGVAGTVGNMPVAVWVGDEEAIGSRYPAGRQALLDRLTLVESGGDDSASEGVVGLTTTEPDTSLVVVVTGERNPMDLLNIVRAVDQGMQVVLVRCSGTIKLEPIFVPDAEVVDCHDLKAFQLQWSWLARR